MAHQHVGTYRDDEVSAEALPPSSAKGAGLSQFAPVPELFLRKDAAHVGNRPAAHDGDPVSPLQGTPGNGGNAAPTPCNERVVACCGHRATGSRSNPDQRPVVGVAAHGPNRLPNDPPIAGEARDPEGRSRREIAPFRRALVFRVVPGHELIHGLPDADDAQPVSIAQDDSLFVGQAHLSPGFTDRLRGHDPRAFVRVDPVGLVPVGDP